MKKLTALLLALVGALAFALASCSKDDAFTEKSYFTDGNDIEKIAVLVTDRELEITPSKDEQISIEYFDGEKEYLDISLSENHQLTIRLVFDKEWTDYIGIKPSAEYRKIKIAIPNNLIAALSASTTNANITVTALSFAEQIDISANGGNILCERLNAGKAIRLTAKNGDITGSIIGGYDDFTISCTVKKGDCNLPAQKEGGEKSLSADCNNGDIDIEFIK